MRACGSAGARTRSPRAARPYRPAARDPLRPHAPDATAHSSMWTRPAPPPPTDCRAGTTARPRVATIRLFRRLAAPVRPAGPGTVPGRRPPPVNTRSRRARLDRPRTPAAPCASSPWAAPAVSPAAPESHRRDTRRATGHPGSAHDTILGHDPGQAHAIVNNITHSREPRPIPVHHRLPVHTHQRPQATRANQHDPPLRRLDGHPQSARQPIPAKPHHDEPHRPTPGHGITTSPPIIATPANRTLPPPNPHHHNPTIRTQPTSKKNALIF